MKRMFLLGLSWILGFVMYFLGVVEQLVPAPELPEDWLPTIWISMLFGMFPIFSSSTVVHGLSEVLQKSARS